MRIAVIGAGIVGVTSAWELTADGHEVTVFERRASVASEASFANAGVVAPGYVTPWAAPGMPGKVLMHLLSRHAPVRVSMGGLAGNASWLWRWWRACRPSVHNPNRAAMLGLARYSQHRMGELARVLGLEFEQRQGYMVLLRGVYELKMARPGLKLLTALRAAILLPDDGVGNCRQFAHGLKTQAQKQGADFRFDTPVLRVVPGSKPAIVTAAGEEAFDAVVVAGGVESRALLQPLGVKVPLAPVFGYSVTAPLRQFEGYDVGPRAALMDEKYKVAISRLGQRVRVAGSAEVGSSLERFNDRAIATLYRVLDDWFPGATVAAKAQRWKGARPMLPDGPPVIGASGAPGVWLNLGHGSSGWALSCGSARVLAEAIAGRDAPVDISRLGVSRFG